MTTELQFTVVPLDGIYSGDTVSLSVVVSPRLRGGDRLADYPQSMLRWTRLVQEQGLTLELEAGLQRHQVEIDRRVLRPDVWEALFTEKTPVRAHSFDQALVDRANRGVASFSMRESASLIKAIYRGASVELALPDDGRGQRHDLGLRGVLRDLIGDLAVHWGGDKEARMVRSKHLLRLPAGPNIAGIGALRSELDARAERLGELARRVSKRALLDAEGHFDKEATQALNSNSKADIASAYMAFNHMPTPDYADVDPNAERDPNAPPPPSNLSYEPEKILDFHQALSALGNYPCLQRALGLVFDIDLPRSALPLATAEAPLFLRVVSHSLDGDFLVANGSLRTAYWLADLGLPGWVFHTASRLGIARGVLGLAALDPRAFGLAQADIDGAMHKTIFLAESINKDGQSGGAPAPAEYPAVFDPGATLPSLRSGGLSLYADLRAFSWLAGVNQSAADNAALTQGQAVDLYAESLSRGMRLDVWDDVSQRWHSLHERHARYRFFDTNNLPLAIAFDPLKMGLDPALEAGWVETAVTRPAPGTPPAEDHYYLHEAFARWAGWSLSASRPDLALAADPSQRSPETNKEADPPESPFKIKVEHRVVSGSLPSLRFGRRYRLRGRWVNLAGLSACAARADEACAGNPFGETLSRLFALPGLDRDGLMYRRFEPVAAPQIVVDDVNAITGPGSTLTRLVIRSDNRRADLDSEPADLLAAARHLLPPRTSVEMAERMGMFDDANGKLTADAATWALIALRDGHAPPTGADGQPVPLDTAPRAGELPRVLALVAGEDKVFPLIADAFLAALPYLPDAWARGVALRDLPGTPAGSLARIDATTPSGAVAFEPLDDPNPRPGSALLIGFGGGSDWQAMQGLRLALGEGNTLPHWEATTRTLTVGLPKGARTIVPVSCWLASGDLPKMGIWQWLVEETAAKLANNPEPPTLQPGRTTDRIAHILQRVVEGGHWMLTPPTLIELVHALRQPLGQPAFVPLAVNKGGSRGKVSLAQPLQTALTAASLQHPEPPERSARRDPDELSAITGWRRLASTEAYLLGALRVSGVSTGQVELLAEWSDPVDDPNKAAAGTERETHQSRVDRIDLPALSEGYLRATDATPPDMDDLRAARDIPLNSRCVGYYDPEHDQIAFVQNNDTALPGENTLVFDRIAAPRHAIGDTRHHRIRYRAVAVSRDADCFASPDTFDAKGVRLPLPRAPEDDFSRTSAAVEVSIPASARPLAPEIACVVPTFGWQRQFDTAVKRSVRYGGGLRVYLKRPWFSSGDGERLGVVLWNPESGVLEQGARDRYKSYFTQWGADPIWRATSLYGAPAVYDLPDRSDQARGVSLDEIADLRVDVAAYPVEFDTERQLWYADLTLDASAAYTPFVRLALARFQPDALPDARLSRVVLADFAQLAPGRAVIVHADPARARTLRVQVSGYGPTGPSAAVQNPVERTRPPTRFWLRVQARIDGFDPELGWRDLPLPVGNAADQFASQLGIGSGPMLFIDPPSGAANELTLWSGSVCFAEPPEPGRYRLLIQEYENLPNDMSPDPRPGDMPQRIVFVEAIDIDATLIAAA